MTRVQRERKGTDPKRKHKRLSLKQLNFINKFIEVKGNATEAAMQAYELKDRRIAKTLGYQTLQAEGVQEEIHKLLNNSGLTLDLLNLWSAQAVHHNLEQGKPSMAAGISHLQFLYRLHNAVPASKKLSAHLSLRGVTSPTNVSEVIEQARKLNVNMEKLIQDFSK